MGLRREDLKQANIDNLTAFWTACGASEQVLGSGISLCVSRSWPSRMWLAFGSQPTGQELAEAIRTAGDRSLTLPGWPGFGETIHPFLERGELQLKMTQELMVGSSDVLASAPPSPWPLISVTKETAVDWTRVAAESFGYPIDVQVILGLLEVPDCHLRVIEQEGEVAATGLLMKTGSTAGIHMMGVPPRRRRRGFARQMMHGLLTLARELGCQRATLQASNAARPLYEQLGFESLGSLHSYRRVYDRGRLTA